MAFGRSSSRCFPLDASTAVLHALKNAPEARECMQFVFMVLVTSFLLISDRSRSTRSRILWPASTQAPKGPYNGLFFPLHAVRNLLVLIGDFCLCSLGCTWKTSKLTPKQMLEDVRKLCDLRCWNALLRWEVSSYYLLSLSANHRTHALRLVLFCRRRSGLPTTKKPRRAILLAQHHKPKIPYECRWLVVPPLLAVEQSARAEVLSRRKRSTTLAQGSNHVLRNQ